MILKKLFLIPVLFLIMVAHSLRGQGHIPLSTDAKLKSKYEASVEEELKLYKKSASKDFKKELKGYYKNRTGMLKNMSEHNHFVFDNSLLEYIQGIQNAIAENNPGYDFSRIKHVITRFYWPNAFSVGDGTIAINVGIFPYIENEDQLAFILCHEYAHYFLNHSESIFLDDIKYKKSDEYRKELKEIKKSEYYQATKLKNLLTQNLFSQRAHSRNTESAADSLGVLLFMNTRYNKVEAAKTMNVLESMNNPYDSSYIEINSMIFCSHVESPNESLLKIDDEDYIGPGDERLKTHPDCSERYKRIFEYLSGQGVDTNISSNSNGSFENFKQKMRYELCESYIHFNKLDRALLQSLRLLKEDPKSEYLKGVAAYSLYKISKARKEYRLQDFVALPHQNPDSMYSMLLDIIHFSRLKTFTNGARQFCEKHYKEGQSDERLLYAYACLLENTGDWESYVLLKAEYRKRFPDGKFTHLLSKK